MKRRIIVVATLVLYAVLLGVTWEVGTRQAAQETEAQLDNAILEFRSTVGGAIDTMLDHAAKTAVRKLGGVRSSSIEEMSALARDLDIDEVNVVSRAGEIVASSDPRNLGMRMAENPVTAPFMVLTNGTATTISQRFRPNARNPEVRAKYLAAAVERVEVHEAVAGGLVLHPHHEMGLQLLRQRRALLLYVPPRIVPLVPLLLKDACLERLQRRSHTAVEIDAEPYPAPAYRCNHLPAVLQRHRHRLFAEDVLAALRRLEDDSLVHVVRSRNLDEVHLRIVQDLVAVRHGDRARELPRGLLR